VYPLKTEEQQLTSKELPIPKLMHYPTSMIHFVPGISVIINGDNDTILSNVIDMIVQILMLWRIWLFGQDVAHVMCKHIQDYLTETS